MERKSLYVAFSNQKGGVGKSAFTTLAASYLQYAGGKNVAVIEDIKICCTFAIIIKHKNVLIC